MAWIKTLDGKLVDAREFVLTSAGGGGGKGKTEIRCGAILCGAYRTPAITQTVKDEIEVWLKEGENGVFSMPSEAELCGEKSQPEHSKRDPKTVQDVKVFPAHDARKPRTAFCCDAFRRDVQLGVFGGNDNFRDGSWWILREGSKHRMNFCPFCSALLKGSMYAATEYKE